MERLSAGIRLSGKGYKDMTPVKDSSGKGLDQPLQYHGR